MRKGYASLFQNSTTPMFDQSSMYDFGNMDAPVDPITSLSKRFKFNAGNIGNQGMANKDVSENPDNPNEPSFSAMKALFDHLNGAPKREDYSLSKMGKFAAALSGAAAGFKNPAQGVQIAMQMNESPFRRAREEYDAKMPALELAANMENAAYGRDLSYQKMMRDYFGANADRDIKRGELSVKERELEETIANNLRDYELNKQRYASDGYKEFTDDKGDTYLFNPSTNDKKLIGRSIKSREVKALESNAASNRIGANASATSASAAAKNAETNASRLRDIDVPVSKANIKRDEEAISASQDIDPQEQLYAQALAAREVMAENPAAYRDFVNEDGSINYNGGRGWFSDNNEGLKEFLDKVKAKMLEDNAKPVLERKYKRPITLNRSLTIPQ